VSSPDHWSLDEANDALPRVRELLERLAGGAPGLTPQLAAEALSADGIVLRDPIRGLIDFPSRSTDGRPLWLCWVLGEDHVGYWHWPEDGFAGRRPVEEVP
jgi:hypothetical protein